MESLKHTLECELGARDLISLGHGTGFSCSFCFYEKKIGLLNFKKCVFCCLCSPTLSTLQSLPGLLKGPGVGAELGCFFVSSPERPTLAQFFIFHWEQGISFPSQR